LADTVRVAGVLPLVGVAVSHVAEVVTVKLRAVPLLTDTCCAGGAVPPAGAVNVKLVGLTRRPPPSSAQADSTGRNKGVAKNVIDSRINAARYGLFEYFHISSSLSICAELFLTARLRVCLRRVRRTPGKLLQQIPGIRRREELGPTTAQGCTHAITVWTTNAQCNGALQQKRETRPHDASQVGAATPKAV